MRIRFSAVAALLSLFGAGAVQALTVDASYQGTTMLPTLVDPYAPNDQMSALSYNVSIDESLLGGTVENTTITITQFETTDVSGDTWYASYGVEVAGGVSLSYSVYDTYDRSDYASYQAFETAAAQTGLDFHGYLGSVGITVEAVQGVTDIMSSRDISLSFGANRDVSSYTISSSHEGVASQVGTQWLSTDAGDFGTWFWYGAIPSDQLPSATGTNVYSSGPGAWNVTVHAPLPASGILLAFGFCMIGALRRRSRTTF